MDRVNRPACGAPDAAEDAGDPGTCRLQGRAVGRRTCSGICALLVPTGFGQDSIVPTGSRTK